MKKHTIIPISAIAATLLLLSGCANYSASSLNNISFALTEPMSSIQNNDIHVATKAFNKADCKKYLDRNVLAKGYQPVQIFIQNNTDQSYVFSLNRISLSCARPEEVAEKVHTSTVGRATAYGVGALFLWPLAIPAVIDGVKSANANESLDNDFSSKAAHDQVIPPHSFLNKLIFVPVDEYQSNFTITLIDKESKKPKSIDVVTG